jgi:hypothetical protein
MSIIQYITSLLRSFYELKFWRAILALLKATVLFLISITTVCVIVIVAYFAISPSYRESVLDKLGVNYTISKGLDPARFSDKEDYDLENVQTVIPDYNAVKHWVLNCLGADPERPASAIRFALVPDRVKRDYFDPGEWPKDIRHFDADEKLIIQLNKRLTDQRLNLMGKVRSSYFFWEIATLASIIIGMVTTILVSLSSTEFGRGDGQRQRIIRVLAIIFPVLGTATAAIINFYSPQAEWGQASRTLASLTQLHGQMGLALWKLPPCSQTGVGDKTALRSILDDWSKRYVDIQTIASASGATPSGGGEPGPSGPGPSGPGPSGPGDGKGAASAPAAGHVPAGPR